MNVEAGDDPAFDAVQEPADVDGELLRLRAGQQHAVVQRVEEPGVADPPAALDELVVHDRDLPGRPTEVDEAELGPEARGLPERNAVRRLFGALVHGGGAFHVSAET